MKIQFAVTEDFKFSLEMSNLMKHTRFTSGEKFEEKDSKIIVSDWGSTATIEPFTVTLEDLFVQESYTHPKEDGVKITHLVTFEGSRGSLEDSATTALWKEIREGYINEDAYIISYKSHFPWQDWDTSTWSLYDKTVLPFLYNIRYIRNFIEDSPHRQGVVYKNYNEFKRVVYQTFSDTLKPFYEDDVHLYIDIAWECWFGTIPTQEQTWFEWVRLEQNLEIHEGTNIKNAINHYEEISKKKCDDS